MYESPIESIYEDMQSKFEDAIMKAIQKVGINVDKHELKKALEYDRQQYNHGYMDGWCAKGESIVHCKDCKHKGTDNDCWITNRFVCLDGFCEKGERKEDV